MQFQLWMKDSCSEIYQDDREVLGLVICANNQSQFYSHVKLCVLSALFNLCSHHPHFVCLT